MQGICFMPDPSRPAPLDSMKSVHSDGLARRGNATGRSGVVHGTEFTEKENSHGASRDQEAWRRSGREAHAAHEKPDDAMERKLEEGLEESMAGSDPVSITQPSKSKSTSSTRKKNARN